MSRHLLKLIGSLVLSCVLLAGCNHDSDPIAVTSPDPTQPRYVPGDVLVGFHDDVDEQQADAMVASHGLRWTSYFSKMFFVWVEVVSGDPAEHASRLSESTIVAWAEQRGTPEGREGVYLAVEFNETATVESAEALIASDPGLRISSIQFPPKWGAVHVEPGSEQHWIEVLQKEPIVRYAQLNYYVEVAERR